jgi:MscS family membrane protein
MYHLTIPTTVAFLTLALYDQSPVATAPNPEPSTKAAEQDPFGRGTPRGCVLGFLKAVERGDYSQATQYLDVGGASSQPEELARQLQVVLNHGLSETLESLSRDTGGNLKDNLRMNRDRAGFVATPSGKLDILLDRVQRNSGPPIWLFSSETLSGVPRVFQDLNAPGIERFLPQPLKSIKFFSLPLWRWLAIILALVLAGVLASLVTRALIPMLRPTIRRMTGQADDRYLLSLRKPVRVVLLAIALRLIAVGAMSLLAHAFWTSVARVLAVAGVSWLLIQFSDIVSDLRSQQLVRRQTTSQLAILALAHRLFKILVLFVAVALLLHDAGVNVSAMLAGLGIGGIALALAAQKTLENFFGGLTIISSKAVRVGDFCQLADKLGTIEDIGLGSTRVRTLDNTIVTIPNGKVAQMNLENYSMRYKIWFHHTFGLCSDTSPEQMRQVLSEVTQMLRGDGRVEKESARIRLIEFGTTSLQVETFAYIKTRDYTAFLEIQEDLMLRIMDIIAASGTSIALPSQVIYLDRDGRSRADRGHAVRDDVEPNLEVTPRAIFKMPETGKAHSAGES